MKLTRQELVNLVKEEMAHPRGDLGKNIADAEFPILVGYEGQSEISYNQEELDNILDDITSRGIEYSLDSLADVEVQDLPVGVGIEVMEKVTITKSRLSEMIRRSVHNTIREQVVGYQAPEDAEGKDQQDDYLTTGQTSIAASPDSEKETQAADTSTRELTQQRQQQLDKDDAVTADDTGRQMQDLLDQKNESKMIVTKNQLRKIIREALLSESSGMAMSNEELEAHGVPTFKSGAPGYHPLFDGNYWGNGILSGWASQAGLDGVVKELMEANMDNEYIAAAYPIMYEKAAPSYLPFGFFNEFAKVLEKLAPDDEDLSTKLMMVRMSDDFEYNPPGW
tara:strand:- start:2554 stop:3564 length:1011 start_codon:yes stop_codon:yes gene_type:complete